MVLETKKIVIVGGGYAGLQAAIELDKLGLHCTLIDKSDKHELLPELPHRISNKSVNTQIDFQELINGKKVTFLKGAAEKVDYSKKNVLISDGQQIEFDYLVLSLGSQTNYFNIPGLKENSLGFITTRQTNELEEKLHTAFSQASKLDKNSEEYKECVSVVVGGGGLTGVEVVGELLHQLPHYSQKYAIPLEDFKIYLIEAMDTLMPGADKKLCEMVTDYFRHNKDCELILSCAIKEGVPNGVVLADGRTIKAKTVLWTGGIRGNEFFEKDYTDENGNPAKWPLGRGFRVLTDEYCHVQGFKNTYAIGDNAFIIDPLTNAPYPLNGQAACKQGQAVAHYIEADIKNTDIKPKKIKLEGVLVSLGPVVGTGVMDTFVKVNLPVNFISRKIKELIEMRYRFIDIRR
jgi:NADH dehydrogenase